MATVSQVNQSIAAFRNIAAANGISPDSLGALLASMLNALSADIDATNTGVTEAKAWQETLGPEIMLKRDFIDANGNIRPTRMQSYYLRDFSTDPNLKTKLPPDIVYVGDVQSQLYTNADDILKIMMKQLWMNAVWHSTLWPETDFDRRTEPLRANGIHTTVNAQAPYYLGGVWLTEAQATAILFERYTPYTGGIQATSYVNLPVAAKSSDSQLSLDYAVTNNYHLRALILDRGGWTSSVQPRSAYRAIDNATFLRAIIGEIDMQKIEKAFDVSHLFRQCPELWMFHIANVPDCIETLDLSQVSLNALSAFTWSETEAASSSLQYLADNFNRFGLRTKPLTVKVSPQMMRSMSLTPTKYNRDLLTWTEA